MNLPGLPDTTRLIAGALVLSAVVGGFVWLGDMIGDNARLRAELEGRTIDHLTLKADAAADRAADLAALLSEIDRAPSSADAPAAPVLDLALDGLRRRREAPLGGPGAPGAGGDGEPGIPR